jgi:hypothetical protein
VGRHDTYSFDKVVDGEAPGWDHAQRSAGLPTPHPDGAYNHKCLQDAINRVESTKLTKSTEQIKMKKYNFVFYGFLSRIAQNKARFKSAYVRKFYL